MGPGVAPDLVHHAVAAVVAFLPVPGVAGQIAAGLLLVALHQHTKRDSSLTSSVDALCTVQSFLL